MLPQDDYMLLSYVNTKLRDEYDSLDDFCEDCEVDRAMLEERLKALGYCYYEEQNAFH